MEEPVPDVSAAEASESSSGRPQAVVLVIDDQQANVRMVGGLLSRSGYEVLPALGGAEGLELARNNKPDVVLLDMKMIGRSRVSGLSRNSLSTSKPSMPGIFMSSSTTSGLL